MSPPRYCALRAVVPGTPCSIQLPSSSSSPVPTPQYRIPPEGPAGVCGLQLQLQLQLASLPLPLCPLSALSHHPAAPSHPGRAYFRLQTHDLLPRRTWAAFAPSIPLLPSAAAGGAPAHRPPPRGFRRRGLSPARANICHIPSAGLPLGASESTSGRHRNQSPDPHRSRHRGGASAHSLAWAASWNSSCASPSLARFPGRTACSGGGGEARWPVLSTTIATYCRSSCSCSCTALAATWLVMRYRLPAVGPLLWGCAGC